MRYARPGSNDSLIILKPKYGNYINGEFVAPVNGAYFTNISPVNGSAIGEFPRSDKDDVEKALDAAHAAAGAGAKPGAGALAGAAENCRPHGTKSATAGGE